MVQERLLCSLLTSRVVVALVAAPRSKVTRKIQTLILLGLNFWRVGCRRDPSIHPHMHDVVVVAKHLLLLLIAIAQF